MRIFGREINIGRAVAYFGTVGGLGLSLWANVRDAYIPEIPDGVPGQLWRSGYSAVGDDGEIHTYQAIDPTLFDLVLAGFFPVALFLTMELLGRYAWQKTWQHLLLRWVGAGGFAAITGFISYSHLRKGFLLAGRDELIASLAPLAVDGFMLLCSTVLLTKHVKDQRASHSGSPGSTFVSHPAPAHAPTPLGPPEPPTPIKWLTVAHGQPSHPVYVPPSRPEPQLRATPHEPVSHPVEPPAHSEMAHDETAAQGPSHPGEPPPDEPVAHGGSPAEEQGGSPEVSQVTHDNPEPPAQAPSEPPEPPTVEPTEPPAQKAPEPPRRKTEPGTHEPVEDKVAQAIRAIDAGTMSERQAAAELGVNRSKIQRARKAIAAGKATLADDIMDREADELVGEIERMLAEGGPAQ